MIFPNISDASSDNVQSDKDCLNVIVNQIDLNVKFIRFYHFGKSPNEIRPMKITFNDTKTIFIPIDHNLKFILTKFIKTFVFL